MLDFNVRIHIITLQEYLELTGMDEEQVWKDWGVVTKHYVYGQGPDYSRAFCYVVDNDYAGAIRQVTDRLLEEYQSYLRRD